MRTQANIVLQFNQYKGPGYKSTVFGPLLPRVFDLAFSGYLRCACPFNSTSGFYSGNDALRRRLT
jgi:hypothetical protein